MDSNERSRGYQTGLTVMMFITWGIVFLDRFTPLFLAPYLVKDLHFNNAEIGGIAAAISISWALSAFGFGTMSDRVGRKPILLPMVFVMSILSWITGVCRNFVQMVVIRFIMGVSEGPQSTIIPAIVEEESDPEHRGRNVGIVMSSACLVGLAMAPVLTTQIAAHLGWRAAFYLIAIPGIIMGFILWRFLREPARSVQARAEKKKPDYAAVFREKNIWLIIFAAAGAVTSEVVLTSFAPVYLTMIDKFSPTEMGWIMGAIGFSGFLWCFGVPWISDRIGRKPATVIFGIAYAIVPLSLMFVRGAIGLAVIGLVLGAIPGVQALVQVIVPAESVGPAVTATAIGLAVGFGEIIGGTIMPFVSGLLADKYGLNAAMLVSVAGAVLVVIMGLFIRETAPRFAERSKTTATAA